MRCLHVSRSGNFIAVGLSTGGLSLFFYQPSEARGGGGGGSRPNRSVRTQQGSLVEEAFRRDAKETCNDVKFSPDDGKIALGSNDQFIYIYSCVLESGSCVIKPMHRLAGHTSYITHLGIP